MSSLLGIVRKPKREVDEHEESLTPVDPLPAVGYGDNSPATRTMLSLEPGKVFVGRYELRERIAIGGMGEVWKAYDRLLDRWVAMKILRPEYAGQELFLSRLRIEGLNSQKVDHPGLARVLDFGQENGLGWIVMELVQGCSLTKIISAEGLTPQQLLSVMRQVACALQAVHDAGVVHRDIKPGNILLTPELVVKLTDFGISKAAGQATLTQEGMVMGTAQYLPPEQALGEQARPTGDLYALGVIAYECLAGKRPFSGANPVDIAFAHVNSPVPALPREIPQPLCSLVYCLLEKEPQHRVESAQALVEKIDKVVQKLEWEIFVPEQPGQRFASADATILISVNDAPAAPSGEEEPALQRPEQATKGALEASSQRPAEPASEVSPALMSARAYAASVKGPAAASVALKIAKEIDGSPMLHLDGGTVAAPDTMPESHRISTSCRVDRERYRPRIRTLGPDTANAKRAAKKKKPVKQRLHKPAVGNATAERLKYIKRRLREIPVEPSPPSARAISHARRSKHSFQERLESAADRLILLGEQAESQFLRYKGNRGKRQEERK